ncbi:hypothetical protein HYN48_13605 [Flavobacterium magnum]|uniref:DUF4259 domain-containing protein n=1 Tax=Flavobacterium magnum TaxID=2162713 RepID=A0A2S0RH87_9FLAO|nr:hypothetical protein [Flavobacterium magnum]AWA31034.1 hypothetical protein HYN48_13605 [Flavobacterium magnum]
MGAWGTGISSNDTFTDIYQDFFDLYNDGFSVIQITEKIIAENQDTIDTAEDCNNFWFALAKAQWECKSLDEDILARVKQIINSGDDLNVWKHLDASPNDLKKREKALNSFLEKLQTVKEKPRKPQKKKLYDSIFEKGDCLTYIMNNGNYGGAFVLTEEKQTIAGVNYIAVTTIDKPEKPSIADFKKAYIYIKRYNDISFEGTTLKSKWVDQPQIGSFSALIFKNHGVEIEVLGKLPIYKQYEPKKYIGFGWITLKSLLPFKAQYAKINGEAKSKLKLSRWTTKYWL